MRTYATPILLALALGGPVPALGDAIIVTKAMTASTIVEVFIEESTVRTEVEIGVVDLEAFRDLMPDEIWERMGYDPEAYAARLGRFFVEGLVLRADDEVLRGRLVSIEARDRLPRDDLTGAPVAVSRSGRASAPVASAARASSARTQPPSRLIPIGSMT